MYVYRVKIHIVLCKILTMVKSYILVLYFVISYSCVFGVQSFEGPYYFSIRRAFDLQMKSDCMTIMALEVI